MANPSRFIRKLHPFIEQYPLEKKDQENELRGTTDAALTLQPDNNQTVMYENEDETKRNQLIRHIKRRQNWFYRIDEVLSASQGAEKYIHDFVHSKNPKLQNQTKTKRIKMALAAFYAAKKKKKKNISEGIAFQDLQTTAEEFLAYASSYLGIEKLPPIKFTPQINDGTTFAQYHVDEGITLAVNNRHPMDVFRSLAHELVHHKQNEDQVLHSESGITGSKHENEANSLAGIIMRDFAQVNPQYFSFEAITEGITKPIKGRTHWTVGKKTLRKAHKSKGSSISGKLLRSFFKRSKNSSKSSSNDAHLRKIELIRTKEEEKRKTLEFKHNLSKQLNRLSKKLEPLSKEPKPEQAAISANSDLEKHQRAHDQFDKALKKSVTLDEPITISGGIQTTKRKWYTQSRDYHAKKIKELSEKEIISLLKKSRANAIPYEILLEVYSRGLDDWKNHKTNLTREQHAFNRVNSFIAGGAALELDKDLFLEEEI